MCPCPAEAAHADCHGELSWPIDDKPNKARQGRGTKCEVRAAQIACRRPSVHPARAPRMRCPSMRCTLRPPAEPRFLTESPLQGVSVEHQPLVRIWACPLLHPQEAAAAAPYGRPGGGCGVYHRSYQRRPPSDSQWCLSW
ncbi:hypothetical protein CCMA1212_003723 [Trichoderma ghanense]|uniref:Uncharacterized protein n=1 Tax=Trichoderma ghanense TaxID=65468 RepID=A0ABY2H7T5_9HYPO